MFDSSAAVACASREFDPVGELIDVFERLRGDPFPWLLESALPSPDFGRFSFAGSDPYAVVRARGTTVELECRRPVRPGLPLGCSRFDADPLEVLRSLCSPPPADPGSPVPFVGGAVGYLGYELAESIERLEFTATDDLHLPDLYFLLVDRVVSFDRKSNRFRLHTLGFGADEATAAARAAASVDAFEQRLSAAGGPDAGPDSNPPARAVAASDPPSEAPFAFFDLAAYAKCVAEAKQEIVAGNVYQVCLTHRVESDLAGDPWQLYRRLRAANPAPFASYFEFPEVAIASSSPERFLRLSADGGVESRPIKGTRPRGADCEADRAIRGELAGSEKDRAENLMIVDLVRNDLGRVCETGSITVAGLMDIEAYAAVFQMVSTVRGHLRGDCDAVDLVRAAFPPGSMTGAPKIAAMEIIDRLEPVRRGIYSGGLGYFDVRGGLDLCVVIRAVLVCNGRAYVHSGGGIVADSDPFAEHAETLDKARPLMEALEAMQRAAAGSPSRRRDQAT